MSKQESVVREIIEALDEARLDMEGGYPSDWVIENGKVYRASTDYKGGPELTVLPVDEFITEYSWLVEE